MFTKILHHVRMVVGASVVFCDSKRSSGATPLRVGWIVYHGTNMYSDVFAVSGYVFQMVYMCDTA